jgi:hypothetical protein
MWARHIGREFQSRLFDRAGGKRDFGLKSGIGVLAVRWISAQWEIVMDLSDSEIAWSQKLRRVMKRFRERWNKEETK